MLSLQFNGMPLWHRHFEDWRIARNYHKYTNNNNKKPNKTFKRPQQCDDFWTMYFAAERWSSAHNGQMILLINCHETVIAWGLKNGDDDSEQWLNQPAQWISFNEHQHLYLLLSTENAPDNHFLLMSKEWLASYCLIMHTISIMERMSFSQRID